MKKIFIFLIKKYKKYISPLLPNACRFEPTCSMYAVEALEKHGLFKGMVLSVWRILRCNPFCKYGYDPVPEKNKWKNKNRILKPSEVFRKEK